MDGKRAWRARRQRVIEGLLAGTAAAIGDEAEDKKARERQLARMAWAMSRIDDLKRAQKAADAAWMALVAPFDGLDEDEEPPDLDPPPEQAVLDAIFEEIHAVTEEDCWPRQLHWSV